MSMLKRLLATVTVCCSCEAKKKNLKEISELLVNETIDPDNPSENRGRKKSHQISHQKMGKE